MLAFFRGVLATLQRRYGAVILTGHLQPFDKAVLDPQGRGVASGQRNGPRASRRPLGPGIEAGSDNYTVWAAWSDWKGYGWAGAATDRGKE